MVGETEPAKLLLPYLQRADELQKHEPLVSYYCRLYAMERGLKFPQMERTKTTSALLVSLMKQLEKDKKSLKLGPEDNLYVEGFASNVFAKADKQDRAGRADLNTAKTFYAASIFFEILYQFGELQPDIEQKQKYAVWKAAEIRKALKEGHRPEPGPPGGDKYLSVPSSSPADTYDLGSSESFPTSHPGGDTSSRHADKDLGRTESFPASFSGADSSSHHANLDGSLHVHPSPSLYSMPDYPSGDLDHQLPPANTPEISAYPQSYHHQPYSGEQHSIPEHYYPPEIPSPSISFPNFQPYLSFHDSTFPAAPSHQPTYNQSVPPASSYPSMTSSTATCTYDINYQPPVEKITEAHKAARFAVGALAFDDVPVAVDFLRRALELLTNPSAETH